MHMNSCSCHFRTSRSDISQRHTYRHANCMYQTSHEWTRIPREWDTAMRRTQHGRGHEHWNVKGAHHLNTRASARSRKVTSWGVTANTHNTKRPLRALITTDRQRMDSTWTIARKKHRDTYHLKCSYKFLFGRHSPLCRHYPEVHVGLVLQNMGLTHAMSRPA